MTIMGLPMPDGVGPDVRLAITTAHGDILSLDLITAAHFARCAPAGELLPFCYREAVDPEDPERPRPLRRATLAIINDEPIMKTVAPAPERSPDHCRGVDCHGMHTHQRDGGTEQIPYCKWSCTLCMGNLISPCIPRGF